MEKLLTTAEVAERYGVTVFTVRNWVKSGRLSPFVITPRNFRYTPAALDDFERGCQSANHKPAVAEGVAP
jgi:excisionase family DNA binding protein